ncbi:MAG: hypothetical protein USCAAHI_03043 [Beijerinckiaceae bacterium]|nr:MAG: hypothetical protein USCAAHI_03043 [Beijerinckiaceae bacterium]
MTARMLQEEPLHDIADKVAVRPWRSRPGKLFFESGVSPLRDVVFGRPCPLPGFIQAYGWIGTERELTRRAAECVAVGPALLAVRLDDKVEAADAAIGDFSPLVAGLDFLDKNRGKFGHHVGHSHCSRWKRPPRVASAGGLVSEGNIQGKRIGVSGRAALPQVSWLF